MGIKTVPEESAGMNPHIKEGNYVGRLAGVIERILEVPKYDDKGNETAREDVPRWEWVLGVRTGDGDLRMTALSSPKMTTKSKAFTFAKALRGGNAPELGVELDIDTELVGKYASLTVKDKQRKDRTGNIQVTSEITDMLPVEKPPEKEISIEGLVEEEAEPEPEPAPKPAAASKKRK